MAILAGIVLGEETVPYVPGQVIVRFEKPTTLEEAKAALDGRRYAVDKVLVKPLDIYRVRLIPKRHGSPGHFVGVRDG